MWSSILGFFGGGGKAAETILDGAVNGIDKLLFTEEEKAEFRGKLADAWIKLQETLGEETSVRGVTRRIIAVGFAGFYLFMSTMAIAFWPFYREYSNFIWDVTNGTHGYITLAIVAFYFGPYFLMQAFEKLTGKK